MRSNRSNRKSLTVCNCMEDLLEMAWEGKGISFNRPMSGSMVEGETEGSNKEQNLRASN